MPARSSRVGREERKGSTNAIDLAMGIPRLDSSKVMWMVSRMKRILLGLEENVVGEIPLGKLSSVEKFLSVDASIEMNKVLFMALLLRSGLRRSMKESIEEVSSTGIWFGWNCSLGTSLSLMSGGG